MENTPIVRRRKKIVELKAAAGCSVKCTDWERPNYAIAPGLCDEYDKGQNGVCTLFEASAEVAGMCHQATGM